MMKSLHILWPSFLTAALGEMVFFALINPQELYLLGQPVHWSSIAIYSVGFLMFWALTSLSCWLCLFFLRPSEEIDRELKKHQESLFRSHHNHSLGH
ncbi:MAG TPA: hypothetical protein VFW68_03040 [Rhodocyclaceae bacterium]|nr:hypothetical protein [Rhodocyclaceae bacterium]